MRTSRRGRRWRTVGMFGLLGLVTNVLLAWMFALVASPEVIREQFHRPDQGMPPLRWRDTAPSGWPPPLRCAWGSSRGMTWSHGGSMRRIGGVTLEYSLAEARFGWPLKSLRWRSGQIDDRRGSVHSVVGGWWINVPWWIDQFLAPHVGAFPAKRRLPIEPVWDGLVQNTVAFGLVLWVILRLKRTIRRWMRNRRQQCLECGYPIGQSDRCTECGATLGQNPA